MKVLHIAPTPFFSDRGCHIRIKGIVKGLDKRGVKNTVVTYHHGRDVEGINTVRTATIPWYTKVDAGPSPFKYIADILLFFKALVLLARERPDIIHGHLHEGVLIGWAANLCFFWRRTPVIFDMQGSLVGELEAHGYFSKFRFLKRVFWAIEYLIARLPTAFLCSSQESVNVLTDSFSVPVERVCLASDGADVLSVTQREVNALKGKLNINPGQPVVIYSGALSEAKGLSALCELIKGSKKDGLECQYLIVGYPVDKMQKFIADNELEAMVHLAGRVPFEELSTFLACADIAVEPKSANSAEASGKLLNYMGAGLPVLCFGTKNNRGILGDTGFFAADDSVRSLVQCLSHILADADQAECKGAASLVRLKERYSWERTAHVIHSTYADCLQMQQASEPVDKHKEDI